MMVMMMMVLILISTIVDTDDIDDGDKLSNENVMVNTIDRESDQKNSHTFNDD